MNRDELYFYLFLPGVDGSHQCSRACLCARLLLSSAASRKSLISTGQTGILVAEFGGRCRKVMLGVWSETSAQVNYTDYVSCRYDTSTWSSWSVRRGCPASRVLWWSHSQYSLLFFLSFSFFEPFSVSYRVGQNCTSICSKTPTGKRSLLVQRWTWPKLTMLVCTTRPRCSGTALCSGGWATLHWQATHWLRLTGLDFLSPNVTSELILSFYWDSNIKLWHLQRHLIT